LVPHVNVPLGTVIVSPAEAAEIFAFTSESDPLLAQVAAWATDAVAANTRIARKILIILFPIEVLISGAVAYFSEAIQVCPMALYFVESQNTLLRTAHKSV
jgi:hypothetical protein